MPNTTSLEKRFSFVLPAFKARYLHNAIESILSQTLDDFELIIVNDHSPEDLKSIVDSFNDPRIRYYENEQNIGGQGLVAQWNHCIEFACGEFLIMASDDDTYHPEYLEKMSDLIAEYPDCNIYRCRKQVIYTESGHLEIENIGDEFLDKNEFLCRVIKRQNATGLQQHIFRLDKIRKIGGFKNFPSAWFADDAIAILMADKGIAIHQDILFDFRISEESITGRKNNRVMLHKKLLALSLWDKFIKEYANENLSLEQKSNVFKHHNKFVPLHLYNLLLHSSLGSVITSIPFIFNQLNIPLKVRIKYLAKSIVKHLCLN